MYKKSLTFIILCLMLVAQTGTDIYLSSIPSIAENLNSSLSHIQYTFSIFLLGFAISQLFYGPISDWTGRKPCALFGLGLYSLMALGCTISANAFFLLLFRFFQGIGAGGCTVSGRAMMQDSYSGKDLDAINSYQSIVWSLVPILAPLAGSYIQEYLGWRYNFFILFLTSGFLWLFIKFFLNETHHKKEITVNLKSIIFDYQEFLKERRFVIHLIFAGLIISILSVFNLSAPLIIQKIYGDSALIYGWSIFFVAISFCLGSIISRLFQSKLKSIFFIKTGFSILLLAYILQLILYYKNPTELTNFLIPILGYQFGCAVIFPSLAAETMRPIQQKIGKAAALFGSVLFAMSSLSSAIVAKFLSNSMIPYLAMNTFLILVMAILYLKLRKKFHA